MADETDSAIDPVCGMSVVRASAQHRHVHEGHEFLFCAAGCKTRFANDPGYYLGTTSDLVCGASVDKPSCRHRARLGERRFWFCSAECKQTFVAAPGRFTTLEPGDVTAAKPAAAPTAKPWYCPMDPEVESDVPGDCHICGMALERRIDFTLGPREPTTNPELVDMTRRLGVAALLDRKSVV